VWCIPPIEPDVRGPSGRSKLLHFVLLNVHQKQLVWWRVIGLDSLLGVGGFSSKARAWLWWDGFGAILSSNCSIYIEFLRIYGAGFSQ
jgi:hypothetical protein